jgi:hydroxymethylpyrimidine pyrophosphatase-like HAD family hydrolase
VLATGRRYRDTLPVAERLGIDSPLITASGALVKRPLDHATLFRAAFGPGILAGVVAHIVEAGHEPVLYTDSFAAGFDFHCRSLSAPGPRYGGADEREPWGLMEYLDRNRDLARVAPDLVRDLPEDVFAGFAMGPREAMVALEQALAAAFPGRLSLHTIRSPRYRDWLCEVAPAGVTKWSGVVSLAEAWQIRPAEICAVGDDLNDLPMIEGAGLGIAMGNADPRCRAVADRVVRTHDEDGLVDVADMLVGHGRESG